MPILTDIIEWVEKKPEFWQIAIDRLIRNNSLSSSDINELKEICKVKNGLSKVTYTPVDFDDLKTFVTNTDSSESILISKIDNIENINALSKSSTLEFELQGLNVIYGDNGSGKSSFVSILKHTCNTRGQKPQINGNIFDNSSSTKDKKAEVEYTGDKVNFNKVLLANSQINNSTLKNVDVFDTFSANHYIEEEDEIAFIPKGLSIIEKLARCVKHIESEINQDLQQPSLAPFNFESIIDVSDCCSAKTFLDKLNSTTPLDELRAEGQWNTTKSDRAKELNELISKLKADDPKITLKINLNKLQRFNILRIKYSAIEEKLSGQVLNNLKTTLNSYLTINETLKASSDKAFSNLPLDGVGGDVWKELWVSAKKFYEISNQQGVFPDVKNDSSCPLCLQDLNDEAKQRFSNFEEFVKNDIQKQYDILLKKYELELEKLESVSFDFTEQNPTILELDEIITDFGKNHKNYIEQLSKQRDDLVTIFNKKNKVENIESIDINNSTNTIIEQLIKDIENENIKLSTQTIEKVLEPLEKEANQLSGEKKIFDFKPKLAREIYRRKKIKLLEKCLSKCTTRTITTFSNELTSNYVNQNLKQNFKLELKKLGFNNIKIETETKGSRGKQYHYLKLNEPNSNNISLKDILSEGEHRCISLATFLSELSISEHKSSVIFDDPVSSLDHKWRNKIAKRIVEEALERQVIVFTHDITFLMMLQEHSKINSCATSVKSLTRRKTETGLTASNPPWDALTVKKRIGILKTELVNLKRIEKNETEEVFSQNVKPFYGKLRETWERFVEEILLNKVVQRFGREIQTKRLKILSDLTDGDYDIIDVNMKKCSTYLFGHDSSGNLIESIPDTNEIEGDIQVIEDYLSEMRGRKRQ